jgi:HlyD family secretion protein
MNDQPHNRLSQQNIKAALELEAGSGGGPRGRWRWWVGGIAIAALVLAGLALSGIGGSGAGLRYVTEKALRGNFTVVVTATGSVQPTNQVDVSSELSGIIRRVLVDYNSKIEVGQPLAELDTDKLRATVENSRAKLAAAEARVVVANATIKEAKLDYERKKALAARNVASVRDLEVAQDTYDRAVATRASAVADVDAARADLKLNETNLAKSCICSPINGIVLRRNVEPGQTVATSFQAPVLFTIAEDLTKMEVGVDIDEADVGKVKEGQAATFSVDAYPDRKFTARIRELRFGSEVIQGVVTYKAVLTADNSDLLLRPGMTATAEIVVEHIEDALTVSNAALRFSPPADDQDAESRSLLGKLLPGRPRFRAPSRRPSTGAERTLWVLAAGKPEARTVTVGATDGKSTQILQGGIEPGTDVIVDTLARPR